MSDLFDHDIDPQSDPTDPELILALSFDCYGTLIDWRGGARTACEEIPALEHADLNRLIEDWLAVDRELIADSYRPYRQILAEGITRAAGRQGIELDETSASKFGESQGNWPAFEDSAAALERLGQHYQLAIFSNVEESVLRQSMERLGNPFEAWVTADQVRSYKPARPHFHAGLEVLGLTQGHVLHCAQSLHHDIRPAKALGWNAAWVNREGEAAPTDVQPDFTVANMSELAKHMGA